ncbi:MAG: sarcosine oxidase subunit alpha family protein [Alphaproteobacteria bacterium]|nr:sarcosine oxidase subunit alpha family protein [Alphaproteobacteria bacterium]
MNDALSINSKTSQSQSFRIVTGGMIDRETMYQFTFNNKKFTGYKGDTLASALLAHGHNFIGRSFKYHRPRGIMTAGSEEPNALVQLNDGAYTEPNVKATQAELYDGLKATSQNCWPNLHFDLGRINDYLSSILPAGFYYKTFMSPPNGWHFYEHIIRHFGGLGKAPREIDPDCYDKTYTHCDILIIGAGAAGLAAAFAASQTNAHIIVIDEQPECGGSLLTSNSLINDQPAHNWCHNILEQLYQKPNVRILTRSTAFGCYDHNYVLATERLTDHLPLHNRTGPRQRLWRIRAKKIILATGAIERPLIFNNNDRPGIMMANSALIYLKKYGVQPGKNTILYTNNDFIYSVAATLLKNQIPIKAIIDTRSNINHDKLDPIITKNVNVLTNHYIETTEGSYQLSSVTVQDFSSSKKREFACDKLLLSGGWNPNTHLFAQAQGTLSYNEDIEGFIPNNNKKDFICVGACNGLQSFQECIIDGLNQGLKLTEQFASSSSESVKRSMNIFIIDYDFPYINSLDKKSTNILKEEKSFVDFQHDVTFKDIKLALQEGYQAPEHLKRYTTLGMGTDQGKLSNINGLKILATHHKKTLNSFVPTTSRPPYVPITMGIFTGSDTGPLFEPIKETPLHNIHKILNTKFMITGQWVRPQYYPRLNEKFEQTLKREVFAARKHVAIYDASSLGKIEIQGPDALKFLNMMYPTSFDNLIPSKCRYSVLLKEEGIVFDDGIISCMAKDHYYITTTTNNADAVTSWFEYWLQKEWATWKVFCTNVTEQWAAIVICGPHARHVLENLVPDFNYDNHDFPYMSFKIGHIAGIECRIFRVSFTGELSYEINVPASYASYIWNMLMTAGLAYNITPLGLEALHILRAEKGYIAIGHEADGSTTLKDLGMSWLISKNKKDFIGKRSLALSNFTRTDRPQLVGLFINKDYNLNYDGAPITETKKSSSMVGYVTSSYFSPTLNQSIALALINAGQDKINQTVFIKLPTKSIKAKIVSPKFFDPEGTHLNG